VEPGSELRAGHLIDLDVGRSIAIYERNGELWVAEFRDGRGEITYASAWFRLYAGGMRYCPNYRAAFQHPKPLPLQVLERIRLLHAEDDAREERMLAAARTVMAVVRRYGFNVISSMRGRAAKIIQTFS
jgi:hypothetical protein